MERVVLNHSFVSALINVHGWVCPRNMFSEFADEPFIDALLVGRRSIRATTPDRLPLAGPLLHKEAYCRSHFQMDHRNRLYQSQSQDASSKRPTADFDYTSSLFPATWVLTGMGSRGLMTGPILGELLMSQILGEPWPVPRSVALGVHPARYLLRMMRKRSA